MSGVKFGKKWSDEEDEKLLKMVKKGKSYESIAKELERTLNSVAFRVKDIAVFMTWKNKPMEEIKEATKLSETEILNHKKVKEEQKKETKQAYRENADETKKQLDRIEKKLDRITMKLMGSGEDESDVVVE